MELLRIPLLNANDDEVVVTDLTVREGDLVRRGEMICVLETTKATSDIDAPVDGYVRELRITTGQHARVGAIICAIVESLDEPIVLDEGDTADSECGQLRVEATKKARQSAAHHQIELAEMDFDGIITARDVERYVRSKNKDASRNARAAIDRSEIHVATDVEQIVILGAGGHARALVELIRSSRRDLQVIGAVDDAKKPPAEVLGTPLLGSSELLSKLRSQGVQHAGLGIGAVSNNKSRTGLYERLRELKFALPSFIHPHASVEESVRMGQGNQIFAGAVVGSNVEIGNNTIINSGCVLSHDCRIGSHAHIAPGALLAGGVTVGTATLVGMGVTVYLGVTIGDNVVIANGVHILHDVPDGAIVRASH